MVVVVVQAGVWGTAVERRRDDDILAVRIVSNEVLINKYNICFFYTLFHPFVSRRSWSATRCHFADNSSIPCWCTCTQVWRSTTSLYKHSISEKDKNRGNDITYSKYYVYAAALSWLRFLPMLRYGGSWWRTLVPYAANHMVIDPLHKLNLFL